MKQDVVLILVTLFRSLWFISTDFMWSKNTLAQHDI